MGTLDGGDWHAVRAVMRYWLRGSERSTRAGDTRIRIGKRLQPLWRNRTAASHAERVGTFSNANQGSSNIFDLGPLGSAELLEHFFVLLLRGTILPIPRAGFAQVGFDFGDPRSQLGESIFQRLFYCFQIY
jgi:hypothetical protein